MAKHKFSRSIIDDKGNVLGARCAHCGKPFLYENGEPPEELRNEECIEEDASQAAARIVREATRKWGSIPFVAG